jgi:hypothetical protein
MLSSKQWWAAAGVRALRTFAQALVATIPGTVVIAANVDWMTVGLAAANIVGSAFLAALLSLFTSIAGLPEVTEE